MHNKYLFYTLVGIATVVIIVTFINAPSPETAEYHPETEHIDQHSITDTVTPEKLPLQETATQTITISKEPDPVPPVSLDKPITEETSYIIPVTESTTVLEAMETYAITNSDFSFSGRNFPGLGFFLEDIGGIKNDRGYYWTLFINNKLSEQGATAAQVSPGDVVLWHYQKGI